jgi:23S rRNA pseudouridine1911/1915/1917 synthase
VRLDLALIGRFPELSRRKAQAAIEKGQVLVDGRVVRLPGENVGSESELLWDPNRKALPRRRPDLPLLHADPFLLVVDKPAGLLSVRTSPDATHEDTLLSRVEAYLGRARRGAYVGCVHRLDRDTSGAITFARTPQVRAALRAMFRAHRIERRYLALVLGSPRAPSGTITAAIHDDYQAGRRRLARPGEPSHQAVTHYQVLETFPDVSLVEISLETGRQHQIRLHLASLGLPVLGDRVYGHAAVARAHQVAHRQMLHARLLAFTHPVTGGLLRIESPIPSDFADALAEARARAGGGGRQATDPRERRHHSR